VLSTAPWVLTISNSLFEFRNVEILISKEWTPQMHVMVEQLLCSIVLTGLRATHGTGVMDLLFARTVRHATCC
jgi:hypothetical protein